MDRVDQGLKPACVTVCTTHCLEFGENVDEIVSVRKRRHAEAVASLDMSTT
jgi:Fe-S-cluster-containing dehydrogenase component